VPVIVAGKAIDVGLSVTVGVVADLPVPVSATVCGEPVALSPTARLAVNVPTARGLNSTEMAQVAEAASDEPQVFADFREDVALVPVMFEDRSVTAEALVFLTVTVCAAVVAPTVVDAKVRLVGDSVTVSPDAVAVPWSATDCGEPVALSAIERDAVKEPATVGLNSTETAQVAETGSDEPQVFADFRKDVALVPVMFEEVSVTADALVFLMVTVCAAVVAPTVVDAKVRLVGDSVTVSADAVAVPWSATNCGEPVALSATESDAVREPAAVGLNSTETVQVAEAASDVPQVVADFTNDVALVPVMVSEVSVSAAVPLFLMVTS
jgi:hypothetical protein